MSGTRRKSPLSVLAATALLGPAVVLLAPGPSVAQDALQAHWTQSVETVVAAGLPVEVTVGLARVPSAVPVQPTAYTFALPTGPVVVTSAPQADAPAPSSSDERVKATWSSAATLTLPSGTPCGSYVVTATQALRPQATHARTTIPVLRAGGRVSVVGCPPELEVSPVDEVLTTPTLPFSFRGRDLPAGPVRTAAGAGVLRLLVDGQQVGAEIPAGRGNVSFHRSAELALGCGPHEVSVTTADGRTLASRTVRLRCPSVTPDVDGVARTDLPSDVGLRLSGFASSTAYDVLLDGAAVGSGTTDRRGAALGSVAVPARARCGDHEVTVRQVLPPVPVLPPYGEAGTEPEPDAGADDGNGPADDAEPAGGDDVEPGVQPPGGSVDASVGQRAGPAGGAVTTARPVPGPSGRPAVVLRAAVQELPAQRTAQVTVPLTVRCPEAPSLEVSPRVRADDGGPESYVLSGEGFGDDAPVQVSTGAAVVLEERADGVGRLSDRVELRLPCGTTTFIARAAGGRTARDSVEVRCPAVQLDPPTVSSAELPRGVSVQASGFDGEADLEVLLDGEGVAVARSDTAGGAVVDLRAGTDLVCGVHRVVVRQPARDPAPTAHTTLTVACPPGGTPVLDVGPEVVPDGHTVRVTGHDLPAGELRLVWRLPDGVHRPALRRPVTAVDGRLRVDVLVLRGEPAGPRQLLALGASAVAADADTTLVVLDSVQPGRRTSDSPVALLVRR